MKHKAACTLIALLLILSCSLIFDFSLTNARAATFSDVHSGDWYYEYVERAYGLGLMNVTGGTSFSPDGTLTRAMFVTVLGRLHGVDADTYRPSSVFDDAPLSTWYGTYVGWASDNGIVEGYGGNRFGSSNPITREQMATIIARYIDYVGS